MTKATDSVSKHKEEIETLRTNLDKAHEFAKNRPKNEYSTQQWATLKNPEANLLGGFLKRWEQQSTMSRVFLDEVKRLVRRVRRNHQPGIWQTKAGALTCRTSRISLTLW